MIIESPTRTYEVGELLANPSRFRLYTCHEPESEQEYMLQVASDVAGNGIVDRVAFILEMLAKEAARLEELYSRYI